jgi:hypothetical protein
VPNHEYEWKELIDVGRINEKWLKTLLAIYSRKLAAEGISADYSDRSGQKLAGRVWPMQHDLYIIGRIRKVNWNFLEQPLVYFFRLQGMLLVLGIIPTKESHRIQNLRLFTKAKEPAAGTEPSPAVFTSPTLITSGPFSNCDFVAD